MLDRCDNIVTEEEDRNSEKETIRSALQACGYPEWSIVNTAKQMAERKKTKDSSKKRKKSDDNIKSRGMVVIPYISGVSEKVARILKKKQVNTAMRPHTTLKGLLVHPKDKTDPKEGVYCIECNNCDKVYVGETKRALKTRVAEHKKDVQDHEKMKAYTRNSRKESMSERHKSAITDHVLQENHTIKWDKAKMVVRERDWVARGIREAIVIRQHQDNNMNRDEGRFMLSHLYDEIIRSMSRD